VTATDSGRRSRRPQTALASRIAHGLYHDVVAVEWIPSDEADVFRLTFSGRLDPRYLKLPIPGTNVVAREVLMLPALRARGFPVLEFEHSTGDLEEVGTAFHVTREVQHLPGADLAVSNVRAARRLATRLGQIVSRLEILDAETIPGSGRWDRQPSHWWRPQHRALISDPRWPASARQWSGRILERLDARPTEFGGWYGEMLIGTDGSFVMIDWTTAGASWIGEQAAGAMEVLAGFGDDVKRDLIGHFLHGYAPDEMAPSKLEELRLWSIHGVLGWAMLEPLTEGEIRLATQSMHHRESSDDPAEWF
jgi:hypothetical protein